MEATAINNSITEAKRERRTTTLWMWMIFLFVFAVEIAGAYVVVYLQGYIMNDAISRTANAYYVLALNPPKLASIGFVWNPLPSLIQVMIMPLARFWPPLASVGFAGCIMTAIFAAINSALLFRYFKNTGNNVAISLLIIALYSFNPFVFFYGFNGMSETLFFTTMIMSVANFSLWLDDRRTGRLVTIGLMLAVGFLTRYEVFALMLGFGFALLVALYFIKDKKTPFASKPPKMKWDYAVATGTVIFLPVLYSILIWMFLNWTIMGDPLFFLNSAYSNESQSAVALWSEFKEQVQNPFTALKYVIIRSLPFILPFGVITVERIFTKRLLKWDYLVLVLFTGCMLGFHYVMLVLQKSFGWLRFFSFALITNIAWLPYELSQLKAKAKNITIVSTCVALLASAAMLPYYFADYDLAREEALTFYSDVETSDLVLQKDIARLINDKYSDSTILYDSFKMANVTLNLDNPKNIITNVADAVFDGAILYPQVSGVDYLVIPIPYVETENGVRDSGAGALDAINKEYPELYSDGADWADLVYDNGAYRVYKVLPRLYNDDRVLSAVNLPALEIADLINTEYSGHRLLLDNSTTGWVHKTLEHPEDAIVLVNESFAAAVKNPKANLVEYIVVPKVPVDTSGSVDAINRVYPALMDNTVDWATVVFENELYYLYEVPYEPGEIELLAQRQGEIEAAEKLYIRSKPQLDTAEFLNAQAQEGMLLLLADPAVAQPLIETLAHPGNLMDELSPLFAAAVENPQAQGIQYIILPAKDAPGIIKSVDSAYPSLYEYGPDWSELVFENETFRVYAVIYI